MNRRNLIKNGALAIGTLIVSNLEAAKPSSINLSKDEKLFLYELKKRINNDERITIYFDEEDINGNIFRYINNGNFLREVKCEHFVFERGSFVFTKGGKGNFYSIKISIAKKAASFRKNSFSYPSKGVPFYRFFV